MKTQTNISNLKKLGLTIAATLVLSGSIFASGSEAANASVNLNIFMKAQEQAVLYKAPAMTEEEEVVAAFESLENYAEVTEASIIYRAPEKAEDEVYNALEDLESFAAEELASIRYEAPVVDQDVEVATELESLNVFADKMTLNLKYRAPESDSEIEIRENADTMMAETR